ncbi:MAG: gamma-glutamyl-gamma-aminobutyrate hydrolase family protein [Clostridiales bacterium]|nr:gamma-glutamyl-gamma-aminobutyrate hydrolase family protein [Clostridiales bacterium]
MCRPIIGITSTRLFRNGDMLTGKVRTFLNEDYTRSIELSGGIPVIIPPTCSVEVLNQYIDMCDGFVIAGGKDIHPLLYDTEPSSNCLDFDKSVDEGHIKLINLVLEADKPILGICRGAQLINVACGGSLYQDIEKEVPFETQGHRFTFIGSDEVHYIKIEKNTILDTLFGNRICVNSIHHQSIKDLGKGLIISAVSNDGIIEGVEMPDKKFVLGVQWHPEMMFINSDEMKSLFSSFVRITGGEPK